MIQSGPLHSFSPPTATNNTPHHYRGRVVIGAAEIESGA